MSSKDKLTESISKTMTISDIQKELKTSNIKYSGISKKSDYVSLYVTSGLHNKGKLSTIQEEVKSIPEEVKSIPKTEEEVKEEIEEVKEEIVPVVSNATEKIIVKEELVMSMTIMGHGCEDLMTPWAKDLPISQYFRNNVRVYSRSCVPDVNSIGNIFNNENIIRDVQRRFSNVPKGETSAIIDSYAKDVKVDYIRNIASIIKSNDEMTDTPGFKKLSALENLSKASSLSTYLANKHFTFYIKDEKEKLTQAYKHLYKTIGVQITDIRLRRTAMDMSVSYEQIFSPRQSMFNQTDIANFNLIYRDGLTNILKNVLNRKDLVKPALEIFGFKGRQARIMDLSLEQIYDFFQLVGVDYSNLMDYSCRACSIGRIPQALSDRIYNVEQRYTEKPVAFGFKRSKKRSKKIKVTKTRRK